MKRGNSTEYTMDDFTEAQPAHREQAGQEQGLRQYIYRG